MTSQPDTSSTFAELERRALDRLEVTYRGRGYEFYRGDATRSVLPERLLASAPDAVAVGASGNEMIQLLGSRRPRGGERIQGIREMLRDETGWKLNVVHVDEIGSREHVSTGRSDPGSLAEEARALGGKHPRAALLLYWSALEGLLREREPELAPRSITRAQLIDVLDSYDYVSSSERDDLVRTATLRNAVAHGDSAPVDNAALAVVAAVVERLTEMKGTSTTPSDEP